MIKKNEWEVKSKIDLIEWIKMKIMEKEKYMIEDEM